MRARCYAFTLAELLIALLILGVIATFTIPKVLQSQQSSQSKAVAKEVAGMISGAYQAYSLDNQPVAGTRPSHLTPYFNYVKFDTATLLVDGHPLANGFSCSATEPCIILHNGAVVQLQNQTFGSTAATSVIQFRMDPDGKYGGVNPAPDVAGSSVQFELYYNGFLTTRGQVKPNSYTSSGLLNSNTGYDPFWFDWN